MFKHTLLIGEHLAGVGETFFGVIFLVVAGFHVSNLQHLDYIVKLLASFIFGRTWRDAQSVSFFPAKKTPLS